MEFGTGIATVVMSLVEQNTREHKKEHYRVIRKTPKRLKKKNHIQNSFSRSLGSVPDYTEIIQYSNLYNAISSYCYN